MYWPPPPAKPGAAFPHFILHSTLKICARLNDEKNSQIDKFNANNTVKINNKPGGEYLALKYALMQYRKEVKQKKSDAPSYK